MFQAKNSTVNDCFHLKPGQDSVYHKRDHNQYSSLDQNRRMCYRCGLSHFDLINVPLKLPVPSVQPPGPLG